MSEAWSWGCWFPAPLPSTKFFRNAVPIFTNFLWFLLAIVNVSFATAFSRFLARFSGRRRGRRRQQQQQQQQEMVWRSPEPENEFKSEFKLNPEPNRCTSKQQLFFDQYKNRFLPSNLWHILLVILIINLSNFSVVNGCSSRSYPKPKNSGTNHHRSDVETNEISHDNTIVQTIDSTVAPTILTSTTTERPNITFPTYACNENYRQMYCLNHATCFIVKIGESILYNCECTPGYWGQRCEYKDLEGSYNIPQNLFETASIASAVLVAIILVGIICMFVYQFYQRKAKARVLKEDDYNVVVNGTYMLAMRSFSSTTTMPPPTTTTTKDCTDGAGGGGGDTTYSISTQNQQPLSASTINNNHYRNHHQLRARIREPIFGTRWKHIQQVFPRTEIQFPVELKRKSPTNSSTTSTTAAATMTETTTTTVISPAVAVPSSPLLPLSPSSSTNPNSNPNLSHNNNTNQCQYTYQQFALMEQSQQQQSIVNNDGNHSGIEDKQRWQRKRSSPTRLSSLLLPSSFSSTNNYAYNNNNNHSNNNNNNCDEVILMPMDTETITTTTVDSC